MKHDAADGFTLVEMLVVIAVISVLTVGATMSLTRTAPTSASEAIGLVKAFDDLRTISILSDTAHSISINGNGWKSERVNPGAAPREQPWSESKVRSKLSILDGIEDTNRAKILILPDGRNSPIRLRLDGDSGTVTCVSTGNGDLSCRPS